MRGRAACLAGWLAACGGAPGEPRAPAAERARPSPAERGASRELAGAPVYDAKGNRKRCAPPVPTCPEPVRDPEFLDRCTLAGYQVRRCGCELVCSGNVMVHRAYYDARGKPRRCEPERNDCSPSETSAAFQDACTDGGGKLVVCGCEWLCTAPPRQRPRALD